MIRSRVGPFASKSTTILVTSVPPAVLSNYQRSFAEMQQRFEQAEQEICKLKKENENLIQQVEQFQAVNNKMRHNCETNISKLEKIQIAYEEKAKNEENLSKSLEKNHKTIYFLQNHLAQEKQRQSELNQEIIDKNAVIQELSLKQEQQNLTIANLKEQNYSALQDLNKNGSVHQQLSSDLIIEKNKYQQLVEENAKITQKFEKINSLYQENNRKYQSQLNSLKRQEAEKDKEIQKLKKELKLKDGILARIDLRKSPEKLAAFNKKDEGAFEQEILRLHRILCQKQQEIKELSQSNGTPKQEIGSEFFRNPYSHQTDFLQSN